MFRSLIPFIAAILVVVVLHELPMEQPKKQRIIWEDWRLKPHLYQGEEGGVLLINFVRIGGDAPLPKDGYKVTLTAEGSPVPLQSAESVKTFNGERLFYLVPKANPPFSVSVKIGNQPTKEVAVSARPSSPLLIAAMLGQANKLQELTSTMEESADKYFYAAISNELQHKTKEAAINYKKALDLTTYRKNEMPNMLLFKRYDALK